jgi:transposase
MSMTHGSNGNGHHNGSVCPSKKKAFGSKKEAERWEAENQQKYPQLVSQFPYPCDACTSWHLTSMQPTAFGMANSRQQIAPESMLRSANASRSGRPKGYRPRTEAEKLEAFKLHAQGIKIVAVAERLGVSGPTVSNWLANPGLKAQYEKTKTPRSIEEFDSEEKKLERQLAEIRSKKQEAIEAKQFKFLPCWDGKGVLIKKEANQMALLLADAEDLALQLGDYLDRPETRKQATAQASGM